MRDRSSIKTRNNKEIAMMFSTDNFVNDFSRLALIGSNSHAGARPFYPPTQSIGKDKTPIIFIPTGMTSGESIFFFCKMMAEKKGRMVIAIQYKAHWNPSIINEKLKDASFFKRASMRMFDRKMAMCASVIQRIPGPIDIASHSEGCMFAVALSQIKEARVRNLHLLCPGGLLPPISVSEIMACARKNAQARKKVIASSDTVITERMAEHGKEVLRWSFGHGLRILAASYEAMASGLLDMWKSCIVPTPCEGTKTVITLAQNDEMISYIDIIKRYLKLPDETKARVHISLLPDLGHFAPFQNPEACLSAMFP